jgi:hypothetical protein
MLANTLYTIFVCVYIYFKIFPYTLFFVFIAGVTVQIAYAGGRLPPTRHGAGRSGRQVAALTIQDENKADATLTRRGGATRRSPRKRRLAAFPP